MKRGGRIAILGSEEAAGSGSAGGRLDGMVESSMNAKEIRQSEREVYDKLQAAEREEEATNVRYSSRDVLNAMNEAIGNECPG